MTDPWRGFKRELERVGKNIGTMKTCLYASKPIPVQSTRGPWVSRTVVLCDKDMKYATPSDCAKCVKR